MQWWGHCKIPETGWWLCYYLVLGFVQHRQKLLSLSGAHVIKLDLSSEMEGHFKKQKVHLFFSFFHPFLPSKYHGKKIKIKNYADALCRVMPSLGYCSQNKCPSTLKRPLFQECPAHQALPYTYWGNALTLELYPILNLFHLGIYSGGGCSWSNLPN